MKLKVCGMKSNTSEVAKVQPDYLGFIFYNNSPRDFDDNIPKLPNGIKKTGVFVDEKVEVIVAKIEKYNLDAIQLHGHESPEMCRLLRSTQKEIIKVFSIKDEFDFSVLNDYEDVCDYFLFDTKGKSPGGNGYTFNWDVLKDYPSTKPYFLSGGIGLNSIEKIKAFKESTASKYCYAIDVNSKFEIEPGLKNIEELEKFKKSLNRT
ncbi:phosphoribosylanthranilate isomerase [Winogradskyella immobilis]|uniref:N-(5'-phosphoribosyl)anthranilate isomerase n=1 Tax=Winogradskyella immobilis TaxID=2816852 RepID=A0ABS8ELH6_9FLAO|nr:phosphoribosylanthranilate isomerase [Winogradskyella immobilis]MCC1484069.1 phosphoribosylanthranilate isomerase [Winogradskyella immobilis]MCG0016161.1 phosphoribosylanthranilate isomerase [Winogradskyella immobilis]